MLLRPASRLVLSRTVERQVRRKSQRIERQGMQRIHFLCDILQRDAAHPADRIGKIFINHVSVDPDRLKDLGTLVRLDRGDPHL